MNSPQLSVQKTLKNKTISNYCGKNNKIEKYIKNIHNLRIFLFDIFTTKTS